MKQKNKKELSYFRLKLRKFLFVVLFHNRLVFNRE